MSVREPRMLAGTSDGVERWLTGRAKRAKYIHARSRYLREALMKRVRVMSCADRSQPVCLLGEGGAPEPGQKRQRWHSGSRTVGCTFTCITIRGQSDAYLTCTGPPALVSSWEREEDRRPARKGSPIAGRAAAGNRVESNSRKPVARGHTPTRKRKGREQNRVAANGLPLKGAARDLVLLLLC
ncbi:hypothetical protein QAD02_020248 [Eretmocerus hayati]|uniref:Uncharacterized protein n=1 Tax=Eretmocerus hayati TaxID=131215 RepID=A0ACC2PLU8_9HYME|nr:hypothetical protein QAD02_020248 [Eretmocerus hayati]